MKVILTLSVIGVFGAGIMHFAPVAGGILISLCIFLLVVAIAGHSYGVEKKKWLEEEQEARRAQPVPPPADGSPATATPGSGTGNNPLFTITPAHELTNDGTATTGKVEYSPGAAHKLASLGRRKAEELELEINETET
jgi:hypothetical protein